MGLRVARRNDDGMVELALLLRQQRDEGLVERSSAGLRQEVRRRTRGEDASGIHRHQPVEARRLFHIGGGDDDAHAGPPGADRIDQLPELAPRQRIDARGRLVEDQQVGVVDQRAAQAELLFHAARELAGRPIGEGAQPRARQKLGDSGLALGPALPEELAEELDILEHRQRRIEVLAKPLRHIGDARAGCPPMRRIRHVAPEHRDRARLERARAGHQGQEAGLADTIGADQPDHAARREVEGDALERPGLAIAQADTGEADDRRRGRRRDRVHCTRPVCRRCGQATCGSSWT